MGSRTGRALLCMLLDKNRSVINKIINWWWVRKIVISYFFSLLVILVNVATLRPRCLVASRTGLALLCMLLVGKKNYILGI